MRQASKRIPDSAEKTVRDIRRATRRHHSAEEKIRIVLEGLRGEVSIAELCRKEGINQNFYYRWSKEFLEAGKKRLPGDTAREVTSDEVKELRDEARQLKETLAEVLVENRLLKKSVLGDGENGSFMRYSASEKLEIIELGEQSTLPIGRTLASIGIPRSTLLDGAILHPSGVWRECRPLTASFSSSSTDEKHAHGASILCADAITRNLDVLQQLNCMGDNERLRSRIRSCR